VLFDHGTLRLLGSDGFPAEGKRHAAADLTAAAADGALSVPVGAVLPLDEIAAAHDRVDAGATGRGTARPALIGTVTEEDACGASCVGSSVRSTD
jgi:NADPH:quinone reductase-like Zn-dependent oxidoreductase